ncbi:uncharacterized protein LOC131249029 [Magnolia sinica]|uniref:uncharacterized protein LOC131249029 n=1 Tax=Magnolia sinica TaxID=86752 RepID=UPI00265AFD9A|nr:uncharacterized protein LOC131249029 [Magnolia sinica]
MKVGPRQTIHAHEEIEDLLIGRKLTTIVFFLDEMVKEITYNMATTVADAMKSAVGIRIQPRVYNPKIKVLLAKICKQVLVFGRFSLWFSFPSVAWFYFHFSLVICRITFIPTIQHYSMATVIGLCLRVKLMCCFPPHFKSKCLLTHNH